ncbi:MAG: Capsular polysaccharide ABC transporter, permease protein KpsM [uncultured Thiotrichaceae bacterium]|uniref:Transport permease protein n=1 Tax=uncultured Thiotrichaceae bacterium TaxID=298394 RepID=A0A6S6SP40_9GAMM|nr:MAG: Capsular polysaccharide ABC transporter, permease protein KpsM [uncultured Thiotrichaceae bacterium]
MTVCAVNLSSMITMNLTFRRFKTQCRVIHALLLRETRTRFDRNKLGYLWALFEPVTYVLALYAVFAAIGRPSPIGSELDLALFFLTGLIPWFLFAHTASKTMEGINSNKALLTYPQVTAFDVLVARAILELVTIIIVFVLLLLIFGYFGFTHRIDNFLELASAFFTIWLLGLAMGFLNSSIKLYLPSFNQTYSAIQRFLFFTSGIFFTAEMLPPNIREIALYNPILHGIEWFRSAFFHSYESYHLDKSFLFSIVLITLALGLAAEHKSRKRARQL